MPEDTQPRSWSLPDQSADLFAVRTRSGRLMVRSEHVADSLWWYDRLGAGIGYEWHEVLRFGPLTEAGQVA